MSFDIATLSRTGGRAVNEDYSDFLQMDAASCWVIADGLGGHQGGATASKTVVEAALRSFRERPDVSLDAVTSHVAHAQAALLDAQQREPRLSQMRSTLVVLVCGARDAVWAHVGDSRLYHLRGGRVIDRTRDHSVGQALVDGGQIDVAAQGSHEDRSRLLRCLGKEEESAPTVSGPHALARGDVFLLCTDGFWEALDDLALGLDLSASDDAALWLDRLEARLRRHMGPSHDNYSATAVRVLSREISAAPPHDPRAPIHHDDRHDVGVGISTGISAGVGAGAGVAALSMSSRPRLPRLGAQGIAVIGLIAIVLIAAAVRYRTGIATWMRTLVTPAAAERPGTGPLPSPPKPSKPEPEPEPEREPAASDATPDATKKDAGANDASSEAARSKGGEAADAKNQDSKGAGSKDPDRKGAEISKPASGSKSRAQAPLNEGRARKPPPKEPR